jgi:hypothetical protein
MSNHYAIEIKLKDMAPFDPIHVCLNGDDDGGQLLKAYLELETPLTDNKNLKFEKATVYKGCDTTGEIDIEKTNTLNLFIKNIGVINKDTVTSLVKPTCEIQCQAGGTSKKLKKTGVKLETCYGSRVIYQGARGGQYVKLLGKWVSLSKLPKKK